MNEHEIKIDPLDFHPGLKDNMAEFESLIRMDYRPGEKLAEYIEKKLKSRFCHCCFFGRVEGELMGEPLCKECAKILYGFDANEERPSIKKIDPEYQLWYRRQRAIPVFEAYLHTEVERYKLEHKLDDAKATAYAESVDAGMRERRLKRALWIARAEWARSSALSYHLIESHPDKDAAATYKRIANKWEKVKDKCLKKSEEYK